MNQETIDKLAECLPVLDQQIAEGESALLAAESKLRSLREERIHLRRALGMNTQPISIEKKDFGSKSIALRHALRATPGSTAGDLKRLAGGDGSGNFPYSLLGNWLKSGRVMRDPAGRYTLIEKHPLGAK